MATIRTFWRGQLRLGRALVAVRLVTAIDPAAQVNFHQIHRDSGQRVRYAKIVPGLGEVAKDEIVYGYEIEPGNFVLLEKDELDALKLDTRQAIDIAEFVSDGDIDPLYFDKPYYLLPDGEMAREGYGVIRDALRLEEKTAIGQLTLRGRESLIALRPRGEGLLLETLRYDREIKNPDAVFSGLEQVRPRSDLINLTRQLIDARTARFDAARFADHYGEALLELVQSKLKHGRIMPAEEQASDIQAMDFATALRQSLRQDSSDSARRRARRALPAPAEAGEAAPERNRRRA
jgi:DNA end-binding protein Ku